MAIVLASLLGVALCAPYGRAAGAGAPSGGHRLASAASPYLRQHASNPVAWYPWGEEAFERARAEDKPIFLSIGYSTCHWCHVMEKDCFEDEAVAAYLNQHFISIKVDREQRPDVDQVYMTALLLLSRNGGWPMSLFLTPDRQPFFGATYIPRASFLQVMRRVVEVWTTRRAELDQQAGRIAAAVQQVLAATQGQAQLDDALLTALDRHLEESFDPTWGGFGGPPKFPRETDLMYLVDGLSREGLSPATTARLVLGTLDPMARGGIQDQLDGGFHRYSTDAEWRVPHFEKMLYNQAMLAERYAEAAFYFGRRDLAGVARRTIDFARRRLGLGDGSFASALDADSQGEEGRTYTWSRSEIDTVLSPSEAALALAAYGLEGPPDFPEGRYVLRRGTPLDNGAGRLGPERGSPARLLERVRRRLLEARDKRPQPLRDDKRIAAWNALMARALARVAGLLGDRRALEDAKATGRFLWEGLGDGRGHIERARYLDRPSGVAVLSDYAYTISAYVALYDGTGDRVWLDRASRTYGVMVRLFGREDGGLYQTQERPDVMARPVTTDDGALPSATGVALDALWALWRRTGDVRFQAAAHRLVEATVASVHRSPAAHATWLWAARRLRDGARGPVVYGAGGKVVLRLAPGADDPLHPTLRLTIAKGWHVTAADAPVDRARPLTIAVASAGPYRLASPHLPQGRPLRLAFDPQPLSVYTSTLDLPIELERAGGEGPSRLDVTFQACDDRHCLFPETLSLALPLPHVH